MSYSCNTSPHDGYVYDGLVVPMADPEETAARMTIKVAGELQDIRDHWVRRLDQYFSDIERLVDGEWLSVDDVKGVIREVRLAAREALDGLGNDLSAVLVHESGGLFARFEAERQSLLDEINSLRSSLARALSGHERQIWRENEALRAALEQVPEFKLLRSLQEIGTATYRDLAAKTGLKSAVLKRLVKSLTGMGYVAVDKRSRPHRVVYLSSPWTTDATASLNIERQEVTTQQPPLA